MRSCRLGKTTTTHGTTRVLKRRSRRYSQRSRTERTCHSISFVTWSTSTTHLHVTSDLKIPSSSLRSTLLWCTRIKVTDLHSSVHRHSSISTNRSSSRAVLAKRHRVRRLTLLKTIGWWRIQPTLSMPCQVTSSRILAFRTWTSPSSTLGIQIARYLLRPRLLTCRMTQLPSRCLRRNVTHRKSQATRWRSYHTIW